MLYVYGSGDQTGVGGVLSVVLAGSVCREDDSIWSIVVERRGKWKGWSGSWRNGRKREKSKIKRE